MRQTPWVLPQNKMPQDILPTRAFQLTVSVKGDLSPECQDLITEWIKKNTHFHYIVMENGATGTHRHLHALFVFKTPRDPRKIKDNVWNRFVKVHHADSIARYAVKVQVCPGPQWYDEYLQKESGRELISNTWEPSEAQEYYPTEAIQEALVAKAKLKGVACPWLDEDIVQWSASDFENTPKGAHQWLHYRMFILKNMIPSQDDKKLIEKSRIYWRYRNGITALTERQEWLHRQAEDGPSYDGVIRPDPVSAARPSI